MTQSIPGYDYGAPEISRSPVSLGDLVDYWRSIIAKQPHLLDSFLTSSGKPDENYRATVKRRFVQWVRDTCERDYDQAWLDYQHEIGLRHTPQKKNATDGGHTPPVVRLRYLITFAEVVAQSARDFWSRAAPAQTR